MKLRRRTREAYRHDRAVVLQQLGAQADDPRAWQAQRDIEDQRRVSARGREGGGHHEPQGLGLVTTRAGAGGAASDPCKYCGQVGAHTADCPVIS